YLYPMIDEKTGEIVNSTNLRVSAQVKELYKFFAYNKKVVDISNYNKDYLNIYSKEVLLLISEGKKGWETMLPKKATELIKEKQLFGYQG
ncbi:MAG: TonB-dependent receptor, partial [Bacteroidota bacterium]|nr:TonB-dependent receptor [Bacteroidota bacterium]